MSAVPLTRANEGGLTVVATVASSTATPDLDLGDGTVIDLTLDDSPTLTFTGLLPSGRAAQWTLILRQDGTGSRTVTWPASVDWPAATAPTLSTGANEVDVIDFLTVDQGTTWLGTLRGLDYS